MKIYDGLSRDRRNSGPQLPGLGLSVLVEA